MSDYDYDVAIVGSGPAGIAVATGLVRAGITNIIVFEREAEIGGIPRHTHHPSFGLLVFKRPISGPAYIKKLLRRCPDVRFQTSTTVTAIRKDGVLDIAAPAGNETVRARHIVLATGARETPRHPRLISGLRPQGVMTTGALQQFIYGENLKPFKRAVIVGTELVSFSALWTMRQAGIKPVAMIEDGNRIKAYRPATIFARLMGVPVYYNSRIVDIAGAGRVSNVEIKNIDGKRQHITCDGVVFSGNFTGDNNLARASHLAMNPCNQIPLMDQNWQSSDRDISVVGNAVHPADMGDQCYFEGLIAGQKIAAKLVQSSNEMPYIPVNHSAGIKMTTPSMVRVGPEGLTFGINLHVTHEYNGPIMVKYLGEVIYQKSHNCLPTRRITLEKIRLNNTADTTNHQIHVILGADLINQANALQQTPKEMPPH